MALTVKKKEKFMCFLWHLFFLRYHALEQVCLSKLTTLQSGTPVRPSHESAFSFLVTGEVTLLQS